MIASPRNRSKAIGKAIAEITRGKFKLVTSRHPWYSAVRMLFLFLPATLVTP